MLVTERVLVFGLAGLIYFGLDCFSEVVNGNSDGLKIANLVLASCFTFVQMFFIFRNSQLTILRFKILCRFGTMHLVATNLCTWIRYLLLEEMHTFHEFTHSVEEESRHERLNATGHAKSHKLTSTGSESHGSEEVDHHVVTTTASHSMGHHAALVASSTMGGGEHSVHGTGCLKDLRTFNFNCHANDFKPFMTTCLIEYSIICAAVMFVLWLNIGREPHRPGKFRRQNFRVDCSASTKGLFVGLFCNVVIIISMIIFFVQIRFDHDTEALWILYASDSVLYIFSIAAIGYGGWQMRNLSFVAQHKDKHLLLLDDILLFVGLLGQIMFCLLSVVSLESSSTITGMLILASALRMAQVLIQTVFILSAQRLIALTPFLQQRKPGREVVTFLIMTNLALFLINTFETQKASVNPSMKSFYGEGTWTVLVHSMVPMTIFYRFHSTVCLAEIWKNAYREKTLANSE